MFALRQERELKAEVTQTKEKMEKLRSQMIGALPQVESYGSGSFSVNMDPDILVGSGSEHFDPIQIR